MWISLLTFFCSKKITLIALSILFLVNSKAQVYYVSSSQGDDLNNGLSIQSPFKSIEKLNSMQFNAGDTIYFKSGDYWEGMFWIKSSGSSSHPIVIDVYGGNNRPIINGFGYQASILIFNNQNIHINGLELYNSFSHLDSASATSISAQTPNLFSNGPNNSWTNVYTACQIGDGNNGAQQIFSINVTNLPPQGANYRIAKTVANQNWYFSPAQSLSLGQNIITVNAVNFDRTVKFQFSSGAVEFDAISLNGQNMYEGLAKKLTGFGGKKILGVLAKMFVSELKLLHQHSTLKIFLLIIFIFMTFIQLQLYQVIYTRVMASNLKPNPILFLDK